MKLPVVAIVGRPNVGKSTLFNALTKTRSALVIDQPGVTRDRQYGRAEIEDYGYIIIDTGGLSGEAEGIEAVMAEQVKLAISESDLILFVVDAKEGLHIQDVAIANFLRQQHKNIIILVNKADGHSEDLVLADFYELGFETILPLSAAHRRGVTDLVLTHILPLCQAMNPEIEAQNILKAELENSLEEALEDGLENSLEKKLDSKLYEKPSEIKIAIIGRPNVGKSTLVNRLLGEDRVIVYDMPGTTRDSIYVPFERRDQKYILIDTAGLRKRGRVEAVVEKFSVVKTLQAIADSHVVINLLDAQEGVTDQDLHVLGFALESGRAMVIGINKWDGLSEDQKNQVKEALDRRFDFVKHVRVHFISAKHGTGVGNLYESIHEAYDAAFKRISTGQLNRALESATTAVQPPIKNARRIKLRYAHMGGHNPPLIMIHGNQTDQLPESYKRYLINHFREMFNLRGTPLRLEFKNSDNPYKDKYKKLTPRQERTQKRLDKRKGIKK